MWIPPEGAGALASARGEELLEFEIETCAHMPDTTVVHLHGEVDHSNAWLVAGLIEGAALGGAKSVVLDLAGLQFADSSFVSAIELCGASTVSADTVVLARNAVACVARVFRLLEAEHYLLAA